MEAMTERVGWITGKASGEHQLPTLPQRASFSPPLARSDGRARQGHRSAAEVLAPALTQRQVAHHAGVPSGEPAANRRCLAASVVPRDSSLCSGQGQTNPALALPFPCSPARGDGDSRAHAARPAPPAAASSRRRFCAIPATHPGACPCPGPPDVPVSGAVTTPGTDHALVAPARCWSQVRNSAMSVSMTARTSQLMRSR